MDSDAADPFELTPSVDPSELFSTIKNGMRLGTSVVLKPYLLLAGAGAVLSLLRPAGSVLQAVAVDFGLEPLAIVGVIVTWLIGILVLVGTLLLSGLQVALYRVVREALVDGTDRIAEKGGIKVAAERFGLGLGSALLFGLMVGFGLVLCLLPGIVVALLFGMVPFLAVATDTPFGETFQRSFNLFKNNVVVLLLVYGALVVAVTILIGLSLLITGIGAALGGLLGGFVGVAATGLVLGQWLGQIVSALIGLPVGYDLFIVTSSAFTLVEARDAGVPLKEFESALV